jgi:GNAT superfamily N-acetyltransferase
MNLSHIYVDEKYRRQNFSRILLCNILEVAKIRFSAEWIILYCIPLYRDDAKWLKQYYEKLGFVDIGFKNLMYANIGLILPNILRETPNF